LKHNTNEREEVIVKDHIEVVHDCVPQVDDQVEESLLVVNWLPQRSCSSDTLEDLLVCVLILTDNQRQVARCFFNLNWEVFGEHIINLGNKTKSNETLDDHGKFSCLTNSQNKDCLCNEWRNHLHGAK
jgi:hypothetical protein